MTAVVPALLLLLPSAWLAWYARDMAQLGHLGDDGVYWVSAQSIAQGSGYRIISLPEQPYQTKYPPLFPALLSLLWMAAPRSPENLSVAALLSWLMLPLLLASAAIYFRRAGLGSARTWVLCGLIATNVVVVNFAMQVMPDLLVCSLLLCVVVVADWAGEEGRVGLAAAAGLIAGAAYLAKSNALPLLVCSPLLFAWQKRWKCAAAFAGAMLPFVAGWTIWSRAHLVPGDDVTMFYTDYLGYQLYNMGIRGFGAMVAANLRALPVAMGSLIAFPASTSPLGFALPRFAAVLAVVGVVRGVVRGRLSHYHAFAAGFIPLLLVWHFPPSERFLLPVLPLLLAGLFSEFERAVGWVRANFQRDVLRRVSAVAVSVVLLNVAACALVTRYLIPLWLLVGQTDARRAEAAAMEDVYASIVREFPASTPFVADLDQIFFLKTGRRAVQQAMPPACDSDALDRRHRALAAFAAARGIQYVLSTPWDYSLDFTPAHTRAVMAEVFRDRSVFQPVLEAHGATVYRILRNDPRQ
jgi:hypothetical protein